MSYNFSRPLDQRPLVEHFFTKALGLDHKKYRAVVNSILNTERSYGYNPYQFPQTLSSPDYRHHDFKDDGSRWELRKRIVRELTTLNRLGNDEEIRLGKGGALPKTVLKKENQAYILTGLAASGKSGIASNLADIYGAIIVDSDYAKRKLPEFREHPYGASVVHEESALITFGSSKESLLNDFKSLSQICFEDKKNIIIPRIGNNPEQLLELADILREKEYKVHLILVHLERKKSTIRAVNRFKNTKRYVPLGMIFDVHGNAPALTYFYLRTCFPKKFDSFGAVSTDVNFGEEPVRIDVEGKSPVSVYGVKEGILKCD